MPQDATRFKMITTGKTGHLPERSSTSATQRTNADYWTPVAGVIKRRRDTMGTPPGLAAESPAFTAGFPAVMAGFTLTFIRLAAAMAVLAG